MPTEGAEQTPNFSGNPAFPQSSAAKSAASADALAILADGIDPRLKLVIDRWSSLTEETRTAIIALVEGGER